VLRRTCIAADGRLHLLWRLLLYTFLYFCVMALGFIGGREEALAPAIRYAAVYIGGAVLFTYLWRRYVDRRPWHDLGLTAVRRGWLYLLGGFALGVAMMGLVVGMAWLAGWISVAGLATVGWKPILTGLMTGFFLTLPDGVCEELMMRGYWYQNLAERLSPWKAMLLMGAAFGLLHIGEYAPTLQWAAFVVHAMLLSVALILCRLVTGSLWLAVGWHAAWNWSQYYLFGIAQMMGKHPLLLLERHGPLLWLGGTSAPEEGLLAFFVDLAGLLLLLLWLRRRHISLAGTSDLRVEAKGA
jgi:membrane protease YdiL (CAAX protease family)